MKSLILVAVGVVVVVVSKLVPEHNTWWDAFYIAGGYLLAWLTFRCRHVWIRRADLDHLLHFGSNKRLFWSCAKCQKLKSKCLW